MLCRCERVSLGEVRAALSAPLGPSEINRVKSITRCGMGRCQGRFCGPALAALVAEKTGEVGRLRAQAPIRPIPLVHDADSLLPPQIPEVGFPPEQGKEAAT